MDNPEIKNNIASEQSENLSEALQNDGKAKKKKRLIILIIIIAAALAVIGGIIAGIIYLNSGSSGNKKRIIKKVIVMQDESDDSGDTSLPSNSDSDNYIEENENFLITILKRIRRTFNDYSNGEETVSYSNEDGPVKTLRAKDFGVKGDGVTDDGKAIFDAVSELSNCGPGSKLVFESNKTYYVKSVTLDSVFYISGVRGLTIDGGNSTFLLDNKKAYASVTSSKDCTLKNMHFDLKTKPAFTAECISVDASNGTAVMKADRDIGLESGNVYTAPTSGWFGVLNRHDSRYHMYISKYEMISKTDKTFKIYFTSDSNTRAWLSNGMLMQSGMICPMPNIGHLIERGFTISGNDGFSMSSVNIHACARFGMYIGNNDGKLSFDSVNFVPAENDLDRNMNFTSWRDTFHVKDNRASISWNNCDATGNYDDIFNISSSTLYVSDYNIAKNRITLVWDEARGGNYYKIKVGDVLNVIDTETGEDCGTAKVKRVVKQAGGENTVILEEPLEMLSNTGTSILAFFKNRCAPGSTITNCNFNGTFRFRGPLTISNTYFFNQRTWLDLYGTFEGPIPENITYKNCTIESGSGATFIIGANSGNTGKYGYHVNNILFDSCVLDSASLEIYESDEAYVSIKNCKEHDGTTVKDR